MLTFSKSNSLKFRLSLLMEFASVPTLHELKLFAFIRVCEKLALFVKSYELSLSLFDSRAALI